MLHCKLQWDFWKNFFLREFLFFFSFFFWHNKLNCNSSYFCTFYICRRLTKTKCSICQNYQACCCNCYKFIFSSNKHNLCDWDIFAIIRKKGIFDTFQKVLCYNTSAFYYIFQGNIFYTCSSKINLQKYHKIALVNLLIFFLLLTKRHQILS